MIHEGKLLLQVDVQGDSFIAALDVATGKELWRTPREEVPTWSTPTVHVTANRRQVIANGYKHIGGYDLETGKELWTLVGGGDIPVPTPVVAHDLIFITNAHGRMAPIYAIKTSAEGFLEMTDTDEDGGLAWSQRRRGNYMQTPFVYGDELYCCNDLGALTCKDAKTGETHYRERFGAGGAGFTSSGIVADGKLYFAREDGAIYVIKAGKEFEVLASNDFKEECMATPAASEGTLFYRTPRPSLRDRESDRKMIYPNTPKTWTERNLS